MVQKINPHLAPGCNRSPPLCIFKRCNAWECSVHFFRGPWFILKELKFCKIALLFSVIFFLERKSERIEIISFSQNSNPSPVMHQLHCLLKRSMFDLDLFSITDFVDGHINSDGHLKTGSEQIFKNYNRKLTVLSSNMLQGFLWR